MAQILEIPLEFEDASFIMRTDLEGIVLILRFDWVDREERWSVSFFDEVENPILMGLPLEIDTELIERFELPKLPPGKIILFDTSHKHLACGRDDLGKRCKLLYVTLV